MTDENVTSINKTHKAKQPRIVPSREKTPKVKIGEIYRLIADSIRRLEASVLPPFGRHYEVLEPELGARLPLLVEDDDSVTVARIEALENDIISYCQKELRDLPDFLLTPHQVEEAAKYYLMSTIPLRPSAVKMVRWAGEPGYTYRRLPWTRGKGPAPTWEALINRMSNAEAFLAWVGSLFFEESSLHNYVWLYGEGGDGKGSINRFLGRVFGSSYRSKQPPGGGRGGDKFWTHGLLGARLVVLPDCDDYSFTSRGLFKTLTGGDPVDVEAKGQMSFTTTLFAKFLIISNEKPSLSSEKADMRRIIYCELGTSEGFDGSFENRLWEEGGAFLTACVDRYVSEYPNHGPLRSNDSEIGDWVSTLEEPFEVIFEKWFKKDPSARVSQREMQKVLNHEWKHKHIKVAEFRKWLDKSHKIKLTRPRTEDGSTTRPRAYHGIEIIPMPPMAEYIYS